MSKSKIEEVIRSIASATAYVSRCRGRAAILADQGDSVLHVGSTKVTDILPISMEEAKAIVDRQVSQSQEELAAHCQDFLACVELERALSCKLEAGDRK